MDHLDRDWLDSRLAESAYIADDGFTGRVVERLPQRRKALFQPRQVILFFSAITAVVLLMVQIARLAKMVNQTAANDSWIPAVNHGLSLLSQPTVLDGVALGVVAAGFALIPFVRRWV